MNPDPIAELVRLTEADIADFEARMRNRPFAYETGDRVEFRGEVFEVTECVRDGMPGYFLQNRRVQKLFLPLDLEGELRTVVH